MDLARSGFATPVLGTVSIKVDTDANGNLVLDNSGVVTAGSKRISFNNIKADAVAQNVGNVTELFLASLPGLDKTITEDTNETTFTVKWEAA